MLCKIIKIKKITEYIKRKMCITIKQNTNTPLCKNFYYNSKNQQKNANFC